MESFSLKQLTIRDSSTVYCPHNIAYTSSSFIQSTLYQKSLTQTDQKYQYNTITPAVSNLIGSRWRTEAAWHAERTGVHNEPISVLYSYTCVLQTFSLLCAFLAAVINSPETGNFRGVKDGATEVCSMHTYYSIHST